ncbi:MAG: hypothetical protein HQL52_19510 [Magnetococcales bacterium]|nr:hypothetical protein [Magnetococcales bacterium]
MSRNIVLPPHFFWGGEQLPSRNRKERLEGWYRDEKKIKKRGALQRTADKEGITRQVLSKILNRPEL